jgi:hypothetical protein
MLKILLLHTLRKNIRTLKESLHLKEECRLNDSTQLKPVLEHADEVHRLRCNNNFRIRFIQPLTLSLLAVGLIN